MAQVEVQVVGVSLGEIGRVMLDANTVAELINQLALKFGPKVKQALFDDNGHIDLTIQILINGKTWVERDKLETTRLKDGDTVIILGAMAGG